jgi:transcriptional regulator with XRE-family HTH domain
MEKKIVTSKEIGDAIKRRRRELGISQERLAEMLNVSYQQVQRYESGANKLNVENIQIVADLLSVPLTFFFTQNRTTTVADPAPPYIPADEAELLKHFRKIPVRNDKKTVVSVARLATRKS